MTKWCPSCKSDKSLSEFYAKTRGVPATTPGTCGGYCKKCSRVRSKASERKRRTARMDPVKLTVVIDRLERRLSELYARQDRLTRNGKAR